MKKLLVLFISLFIIIITKSNPVVPPPIISEFYIVNDSTWYLELVFNRYMSGFNFNELKIETSSGSSLFKKGIPIKLDSIIVITQDSMQSPLHFNRNGDYISISDTFGYTFHENQIYFGDIENSQIFAPLPGQSIVNISHLCFDLYSGNPRTEYILAISKHPTIGYNAFTDTTAKGTFAGIVYDLNHKPIKGINLGDITPDYTKGLCGNYFYNTYTDSAGKFSREEYSIRYLAWIFFNQSTVMMDSTVNIEPDSINYYEFTIDTILSGIHNNLFRRDISLSCFPNPSGGETTISFTIPTGMHSAKALIKIYDLNGEIVRILPLETYYDTSLQNRYSIIWDGKCYDKSAASGIYNCNLELNGMKVATNKIIITR